MKVNEQEASPGCYIAGHHGQYGIDGLADICDQFGIELNDKDRPGYYREIAETADYEEAETQAWELWADAGTTLEDVLNNATEGGCWEWFDGELFLRQTEVEERIVMLGDDYDDAWQRLLEGNTFYSFAPPGADKRNVFEFNITIRYEPED